MASPTQWTWVWVDSGSWWWTGRPGVLQFMGSQRVGHNWLNWLTAMSYKNSSLNIKTHCQLKVIWWRKLHYSNISKESKDILLISDVHTLKQTELWRLKKEWYNDKEINSLRRQVFTKQILKLYEAGTCRTAKRNANTWIHNQRWRLQLSSIRNEQIWQAENH